ncbi:MAG: M1 family peptidase, partial [Gemmatimonadetes bacterium]|nr:M1 family peptidase [Gemmatimonadota bacterium]
MPRTTAYRTIVLAALSLGSACVPFRGHAPAPEATAPVGDTATRLLLRPVPVTPAYRAAVQRGTRTATGAPGPNYWQQRVRYRIDAELDPQSTLLHGRERIVYRNNSPVALRDVVLNLYQNIFTENVPRNRYAPNTGGITLERVAVDGTALTQQPVSAISVLTNPRGNAPMGYSVQGTLGRLILPRMLIPGDSTVLEIDWHFKVPPYVGAAASFRTGWEDALGGRVLQVAQWYPQVAVYDDVYGWDATPYLGEGEFYLEYGDFDVALTLPAGWLVGATGTLRNPEQVLTPEARQRLAGATAPDAPVHVVTEADLAGGRATQPGSGGRLTWRFQASDVRDFAFATSDRYLWDATRAQVPTDDGAGTRSVTI